MRKIIITFILILLISTVSVSAFRLADYITGNAVRELSANNRRVSYSGCTPNADGSVTATATSRRSGERQVTLRPNRRGTVAYTCNGNSVVRLKGRSGNRRIGFTTAVDEATRRHNQFNNGVIVIPGQTPIPRPTGGTGTAGPFEVDEEEEQQPAENLEQLTLLEKIQKEDHCVCHGLVSLKYDISLTTRDSWFEQDGNLEDDSATTDAQNGIQSKSESLVSFDRADSSILGLNKINQRRKGSNYVYSISGECRKTITSVTPKVDYTCDLSDPNSCNCKCSDLILDDMEEIQDSYESFTGQPRCKFALQSELDQDFGPLFEGSNIRFTKKEEATTPRGFCVPGN